ncbi:hypothetical protein ABT237_24345 [Streptomyces sp. NPDC001581]|uniref:hypothetical protein n=1 Tax=Streptomyces sp. NPDC001581 TaxID=3154386 RepID=UPI00332908E7
MSGADEGVPAGAQAVWAPLSGFAEAAAVVLATPSECREAMLGALDRCWEELGQAGRHQPPYANDAKELFDQFEAARTALQLALWAAAAAGPPPGGGAVAAVDRPVAGLAGAAEAVARPGAKPPSAAADLTDPDRTDPDRTDPDRAPTGAGGTGGTGASGAEPAHTTQPQPQPGDTGPGPLGQVATDQAAGPAPAGPLATGSAGAAAAESGTQSPSGGSGPGPTDRSAPGRGTTGTGGTATAANGTEPATTGNAPTRPGTTGAGTTGAAAAVPGTQSPSGDAGATTGTGTGTGAEAGAPAKEEPAPDPLAGFAEALGLLEAELFAEQIRYLPRSPQSATAGPPAPASARIAATWQRVHMALLRLPAAPRTEWRARADEAAAAAGLAVTAEDSADPDVIVPGLPQGLYPAERVPLTIVSPRTAASRVPAEVLLSLGTTAGAVLDLPSTDPRLAWAVRADQALRLVELDPELHVAALVEEQPSSLAPQDERVRYRQHLDRLLGSAGSSQASGWPADGRLGAAHNLDMVLGGLVHERPAAPGSWWWQWRTAVSRILAPLAESAGYELVLKPVGQWRKHDLESYAVKQTVPGVGQAEEPLVQWVVWTPLKPKSSYTRNERKGRVVIRPVTQYGRQAAP